MTPMLRQYMAILTGKKFALTTKQQAEQKAAMAVYQTALEKHHAALLAKEA